jgi:hypothetical protein
LNDDLLTTLSKIHQPRQLALGFMHSNSHHRPHNSTALARTDPLTRVPLGERRHKLRVGRASGALGRRRHLGSTAVAGDGLPRTG